MIRSPMADYPGRLFHNTPAWVDDAAWFHVRIRTDPLQLTSLTDPRLASDLLLAAQRYHELKRWNCTLFLIMPDHIHALLSFGQQSEMPEVIRHWKRGTARFQGVRWQENFFDHRLRSEKEKNETWHYIRRNPLVKNLCAKEDDWQWSWSGA